MFNIEYRFTHTYEDKFSKPFSRSISFAEKQLNKLTGQTIKFEEGLRDIPNQIDKIRKNLKGKEFKINSKVKEYNQINVKTAFKDASIPKIQDTTYKIKPNLEEVKIPDIQDKQINIYTKIQDSLKEIKKEGIYTFKPQLSLDKKFFKRTKEIQNNFKDLGYIKINPDDKKLKDLEKEKLNIKASVEPDISQIEKIEKQGLNLNLFMANIDTGDAKEQLLSFSEGLFEATKYGLEKAQLGKEIARQVKELDGLVSMSEMSNAVVSALKVGIRGSEKELTQYAKEIQKFHELTGKSYEESAQLIYKLKDKFKLPSEEISKVIDEMAVLRKEFAITEDDLTDTLSSVKNEFGYLMSAMDKTTRSKFTEEMLKWSASLEQMHISAKESFDFINKALQGDTQALTVLSQGGISFSKLQEAMQKGDIKTVANAYQNAIIKIGKQLQQASPMMRKQLMQMYGLTDEMANSFMEVANNAEEFQKQTEKAFDIEIKGGEAQEQWEKATNPFTKGLQKFKNEVSATIGDIIPMEIFDALSGVGNLFFLYLGTKGLGKLLPFANKIGGKIKDKILGGFNSKIKIPNIKANVSPQISKTTSLISKIDSTKAVIPSKGLGFLGKIGSRIPKIGMLGSLIAGGATLIGALNSDEDKTSAVSKAVGGIGGSTVGAMIGATVGSVIPVVGTAIGGILGSIAGGFIGERLGGFVGENLKEDKKEDSQILQRPQKKQEQGKNDSSLQELLNAIYSLQAKLSNIENNTALLQQMNELMTKYIELLTLMTKGKNANIDDMIFKGFNR